MSRVFELDPVGDRESGLPAPLDQSLRAGNPGNTIQQSGDVCARRSVELNGCNARALHQGRWPAASWPGRPIDHFAGSIHALAYPRNDARTNSAVTIMLVITLIMVRVMTSIIIIMSSRKGRRRRHPQRSAGGFSLWHRKADEHGISGGGVTTSARQVLLKIKAETPSTSPAVRINAVAFPLGLVPLLRRRRESVRRA